VNSAGSYTVSPGRCAIINADEPFYSRTFVGERGSFECALAVVPEHLVLSSMPWVKGLSTSFEVGAEHRHVVTSLLDLLCFEGDRLGRRTAEPLAEAFLQSISEGECIQKYLTCADLTCDRVAAYCGISPRYLCYVMKAHQTSFSDLMWGQRLPRARDWLISQAYQRYPIHKIARMAGFKSAAHFSRMFKSTYDLSPKEYRAVHVSMQTKKSIMNAQETH
jgi:AraC family transcriptional regulator, positive regulator of tynA and feaB